MKATTSWSSLDMTITNVPGIADHAMVGVAQLADRGLLMFALDPVSPEAGWFHFRCYVEFLNMGTAFATAHRSTPMR
jgi:hypothetical protein